MSVIEKRDGEKKGNETGDEVLLVEEGMVMPDSMEPGTATVVKGVDGAAVLVEEGFSEGMVMAASMEATVVGDCGPDAAGEREPLLAGFRLFGRLIAKMALLIAEITKS